MIEDNNTTINAEYGVIGSMLISPDCVDIVREIITVDDLQENASKAIFNACCEKVDNNEPYDVMIIAGLPEVSDSYVKDLYNITPSSGMAASYARTVKEGANRNRVIEIGVDLQNIDAYTTYEDAAQDAIEKLQSVVDRNDSQIVGSIDSLVNYNLWVSGRVSGESSALATGIPLLDQFMNGGFEKGGLYIIGARPGVGKSSVSLVIADQMAKEHNVLYVTMEMPPEQLNARRVSNLSGVRISSAMGGFEQDSEKHWEAIGEASNELSERRLFFNTAYGCTVNDIRTMARKTKADAVFIDYLGLITVRGKFNSQYEKITYISAQLKKMALSMNIPVIAACQLNREASATEPSIHNLRDSGSIEQDADAVILLHRPDIDTRELWQEFRFILCKNRNGPVGTIKVEWCAQNGRMRDDNTGYKSWR